MIVVVTMLRDSLKILDVRGVVTKLVVSEDVPDEISKDEGKEIDIDDVDMGKFVGITVVIVDINRSAGFPLSSITGMGDCALSDSSIESDSARHLADGAIFAVEKSTQLCHWLHELKILSGHDTMTVDRQSLPRHNFDL